MTVQALASTDSLISFPLITSNIAPEKSSDLLVLLASIEHTSALGHCCLHPHFLQVPVQMGHLLREPLPHQLT